MVRKTTSIKVDDALWKKAKKLAIDKDMKIADLIEDLLKKELMRESKK